MMAALYRMRTAGNCIAEPSRMSDDGLGLISSLLLLYELLGEEEDATIAVVV